MFAATITASAAETDRPEQRLEDQQMAAHLEGHHGLHAVAVARFFVTRNELAGDLARAERWDGIASRILLRQRLRLLQD